MHHVITLLGLFAAPLAQGRSLTGFGGSFSCCDRGFTLTHHRRCPPESLGVAKGFCRNLRSFKCCSVLGDGGLSNQPVTPAETEESEPPQPPACCGDGFTLEDACEGGAALQTPETDCVGGDGKVCCSESRVEVPQPPDVAPPCCDAGFTLEDTCDGAAAFQTPDPACEGGEGKSCCSESRLDVGGGGDAPAAPQACCDEGFFLEDEGACPGAAAVASVNEGCTEDAEDKLCCSESRLELPQP